MKTIKIKESRLEVYHEDVLNIISNVEGIFLAGGCFRTLINKDEPISDYDLFFYDKRAIVRSKEILDNLGWVKVFECPLGELTTYKKNDDKLQLITKKIYSSVYEAVESFDITACCAGFDVRTRQLITHPQWVKDVRTKTIDFNVIEYPVATLNRVVKYYNKGYRYRENTLVNYVKAVNSQEFDENHLALYID